MLLYQEWPLAFQTLNTLMERQCSMGESMHVGIRAELVPFPATPLVFVLSWTNYLTYLKLSCLIYKMEIIRKGQKD